MRNFFYLAFILIITTFIFVIFYLSYFGLETKKFDSLIKEKANSANQVVKIEFEKTKIFLRIRDLKILIKLQDPKILLNNNKIDLSKFDLTLSIKSFLKSDFILKKVNIAFNENNIKDITKVTSVFLPKFINKKLNNFFIKGNLSGEIIIPFRANGSIDKNYKFYGKILNADVDFFKKYKFKNLTAEIKYGEDSALDKNNLLININKASFINLDLSKSIINIKFDENKKLVKTLINSKGTINSSDIKKISYFLGKNITNLKDFTLNSNLKTNIEFDVDKKFKIKNVFYNTKGDINNLEFKINENNIIKNFLPSFNSKIILKNTRVNFSQPKNISKNQTLYLKGEFGFENKFEKFSINQIYDKKTSEYSISGNSSLNNLLLNVDKLNYKKDINKPSQIKFDINFIVDNYFLIKNLIYNESKSKIAINHLRLNSNYEIVNLSSFKVLTYKNKINNNDFSLIKKNKIIVAGKVFDLQPLLKSLFKNDKKKSTFSKKLNADITVNFDKAITVTGDDISDLGMIASINSGSFNKLSLKGSFTENELIEMSIYQVNKDKKTLQVISDRARPFIEHYDFIEGFEGGKLDYESNIFKEKTISKLTITNFKVSKVPALAQLLTLASLQGIADTLGGEGIRFESFEMKSTSKNNLMNIEDALAMGPAVSILMDGYIEKGKNVSLRGTLVPATKLNSIIARIPIVGGILVGKKTGEGVVGVSFKMEGPPKNIKTTVNPIKTLTPRFILRALEKIKKGKKENSK